MARFSVTDDDQKLIDEYLKNGGEVTVCKKFERTEDEDIRYLWKKKAFGGAGPKPDPKDMAAKTDAAKDIDPTSK